MALPKLRAEYFDRLSFTSPHQQTFEKRHWGGYVNGLYSKYQPRYADLGVAVFPCAETGAKKPVVANYLKMGPRASDALAKKFPEANGIGFAAGVRNRITVLDVDTPDRSVLDAAIERHGEPRLIVQTASGKFHGYYRYSRERRSIRAWGDGLPIDLLGGGLIVAPPSLFEGGQYKIIHGTLDDLRNLTPLRGIEEHLYERPSDTSPSKQAPHDGINQGQRNDWMVKQCLRAAKHCDTFDALVDVARTRNQECEPPLEDTKVMEIATWAWKKTEQGLNLTGQGHGAWFPITEIIGMSQDQDAFFLLAFLRAHQGPDATFMVANGLAASLGWSLNRLRAARSRLIKRGYFNQVQLPVKGTPARYRWN